MVNTGEQPTWKFFGAFVDKGRKRFSFNVFTNATKVKGGNHVPALYHHGSSRILKRHLV